MRELDLEVEVDGDLIVGSELATRVHCDLRKADCDAPIDPEEAHRE